MLKRITQYSTLALAAAILSAPAAEPHFTFPESGLEVDGRVTLLAIDDNALRDREGLTLTLSKPEVHPEPVITPAQGNPNAPDSMAAHFYGTVLHDAGKFRMWYYAVSLEEETGKLMQGPVCYAESADGLVWTKPKLGQVEINGSTANNAIKLPDEVTQCAAIIIDEEDPDPARRYKMVYTTLSGTWLFRPATSPDGLHWTAAKEFPTDKFLEMGSFFKFGGRYIAHGQGVGTDDEGNPEGRQGYASTSTDFVHWDKDYLDAFRVPEPEDVSKRGLVGDYPQVHLGVGAASFGNVAVGLWGIWHNPSEADRRKEGWYGAGLITCDLGLVVSNDGVNFREPVPGAVYISGEDSPVTPAPGISAPTILCQANGILNVGEKTYLYHGRWRNAAETRKHYYAEVALATLPRDRWGALHLAAGAESGTVWSAPIALPEGGARVVINADSTAGIGLALTDESGTLLHDGEASANGVFFSTGGNTVRLKITIKDKDVRLYALYLEGIDE